MRFLLAIIYGLATLRAVISQETAADSTIYAKIGDTVQLPCNDIGQPAEGDLIMVTWEHTGDGVIAVMTPTTESTNGIGDYDGRVKIDNATYDLVVDDLNLEDDGEYKCKVYIGSAVATSTANLAVYAAPSVSVQSNPLVLPSGESSGEEELAICTAEGASLPFSMKWVDPMTNEEVISDSFRMDTINKDNNLTDSTLALVIDAEPAYYNEKVFSCIVTDTLGDETSNNAMLSLTARPNILSFPNKDVINVEVGDTKIIKCIASGVPTPQVTWFQGSKKLTQDVGKATLEIPAISIDEPKQKFTCTAVNEAGRSRKSLQVDTQGRPIVLPSMGDGNKTEIIQVDSEQKILTLSCLASAKPVPDFIWKIEDDNSSDIISEVNKTLDGNFATSFIELEVAKHVQTKKKVVCVAQNSLGADTQEWIVIPDGGDTPDGATHNAGVGLIVGIVIAVIFALLLIGLICFLRQKRSKSAEGAAETGLCGNMCKRRRNKLSIEGQENDQIKEVCEDEGTKEEKQKLTAAEEQPGACEKVESDEAQQASTDEVETAENKEDNASDNENAPEEAKEKKKRRLRIQFLPSKCCRSSKKQLKEESVEEEDDPKDEPENDDTEQKAKQNIDADSGKGDTLEKVIDEPKK